MTNARLAGAMALFALAGSIVWSVWQPAPSAVAPTQPTAKRLPSAQPMQRPGRTYLSPAQLRDAVQAGELDRPVESLLTIDQPLEYGGYRWDETGIPQGPTWIRVDLNSQILSVFRAGHEIGTAVVLYGAKSKETPPGTYPILAKARSHRSSIYDADMPFTLRMTHDGISIHGSHVRWGAATHGCIGVPMPFAEKLFDTVAKNDDVVVLRMPKPVSAKVNS